LKVIDDVLGGGLVLQDFCPLAESLEWELGQTYWQERGSQAFSTDNVPFHPHNNGNASMQAAEVFFASVQAAERAGQLPEELFVLELGIGLGLFARYFLDAFRHLCDRAGADYYDRLCYVAADYSEQMLRDAERNKVFANHPGRYRLRVADALDPARLVLQDPDLRRLGPQPFRAVFLNYVLDCLPPAVVKLDGERLLLLHVQTCVPPGTDWSEFLDVSEGELRRLARSGEDRDRRALRQINHLLTSVYDYRPVEPEQVPYADFVAELARGVPGRPVIHNHGALRSLEALLRLLGRGGFILLSDYGWVKKLANDDFEHQRFAQATAVGLNFELLGTYFTQRGPGRWVEPPGPEDVVFARLLGEQLSDATLACFAEQFAAPRRAWLHEPVQRAQQWVEAGRVQAGLAEYREALARQPMNWALMNEVADLLNGSLKSPEAAVELTRAALALNPECSAHLYNTLADGLFSLGEVEEAHRATEKALAISPDDVQARYSLACLHAQAGELPAALERIAQGLALDRTGTFREHLLQKQADVLAVLDQQLARRSQGQANRVSRNGPPINAKADEKITARRPPAGHR
jgi:tetratricopeptide (TPR) repeat protein